MLRLTPVVGRSKARWLRKSLVLASIAVLAAGAAGCSPANENSSQASGDRTAAVANSEAENASGIDPQDARSASDARSDKTKPRTATAPIPVDSEGYVTLGEFSNARAETEVSSESAAATALSTDVDIASPAPDRPASAETNSAETNSAETKAVETNATEINLGVPPTKAETVALQKSESVQHSAESGLASYDEKHQEIAKDWPKPQALLFLTGQQHGYIEPCGCTGLENQKGGLNRRDTLLQQLKGRGWDVLPMDVGNFERRAGRQAEIKFQTTVDALKDMQYRAATLGVDDLKLSSTHLLSLTATEGKTETPFISSNAYVLIEEYMPKSKIIEAGGRKIGITAVLGDSFRPELASNSDVITSAAAESLRPVLAKLKNADCDYLVLLAHATLEESQQLAKDVPGFDLVVTAGGYPEPFYQLEEIEGSRTKLAQVGAKGMYTVLIGLYPDSDQPVRYQRVALSSQFADSPRMLGRFASYQKQLQSLGFDGLGLRASTFPDGRQFVGSDKCGDCHTQAHEVWKASKHFGATDSLVHPPNDRGMIPRHFDPECLSCHVTGWNAKSYFPYASGYKSLEQTPMLTGAGCENCHGPGSKHVAAENGEIEADVKLLKQLQEQMRLPLAEAKARCLDCHDQDNSPEFQHEGAFEKYWEQIAHPGKY